MYLQGVSDSIDLKRCSWLNHGHNKMFYEQSVLFQNVQDCVEIQQDSAIGDVSRDLATIHQLCATHMDDLKLLADTQVL